MHKGRIEKYKNNIENNDIQNNKSANIGKSVEKNRSSIIKTILMTGILFCCVLPATGCGKESDGWDPDKIVYSAEYKELDLDIGEAYVIDTQVLDGSLYLLVTSYSEEGISEGLKSHKIDIASGEHEQIPLFNLQENESIQTSAVNGKGGFTYLASAYGAEDVSYRLYEATPDGQKTGEIDITDILTKIDSQYVDKMVSDGQGNLYITSSNETGQWSIIGIDVGGRVKDTLTYSDYIDNILCTGDGSVYILAWGSRGIVLKKADFESQKFGPDIVLNGFQNQGNLSFASGGTTGILLKDNSGIYECDIETGNCVKILDWIDSDINANSVDMFGALNDKDFWAFSQYYGMSTGSTAADVTMELAVLNQTTAGELPRKEIITYGGMWIGTDIREAIVRFNKSSAAYRIQLKEYGADDYEAALVQYHADLAGANCPDIIDLSQNNIDQLVSKGILADIYPFMDQDETFRREDYLENVLSSYERDGKLYGILTEFVVNGLVGSAEKLQGIEQWNIQEMIEFAGKYPESDLLYGTADSVLSILISSNLDQFINWETGECYFRDEDFIRILEYAKTYGTEFTEIGTREGIRSGAYLLRNESVNEVSFIQVLEGMFDGKVKIIGFPNSEGSGIGIVAMNSMGMSDRSKHKEGVWEFFAYLLSEEYQNNRFNRWMLPLTKSGIEELCQEALHPDENETGHSWGYDDFTVDIVAATEEQVTQFKEMIDKAQISSNYDTQMYNIIDEETESYFAGQKSAQEVADIIQSRVQIYVSENG